MPLHPSTPNAIHPDASRIYECPSCHERFPEWQAICTVEEPVTFYIETCPDISGRSIIDTAYYGELEHTDLFPDVIVWQCKHCCTALQDPDHAALISRLEQERIDRGAL